LHSFPTRRSSDLEKILIASIAIIYNLIIGSQVMSKETHIVLALLIFRIAYFFRLQVWPSYTLCIQWKKAPYTCCELRCRLQLIVDYRNFAALDYFLWHNIQSNAYRLG